MKLETTTYTNPADGKQYQAIKVPYINGQTLLIIPQYADVPLLPAGTDPDDWKADRKEECDALFDGATGKEETDLLLELGSKAAIHVRKFGCNLPPLGQLMWIMRYRRAIDETAKELGGSLLGCSAVWSCSRYLASSAWFSYGHLGFANVSFFYSSVLAVPCTLLESSEATN